jgi:hypothetical protein
MKLLAAVLIGAAQLADAFVTVNHIYSSLIFVSKADPIHKQIGGWKNRWTDEGSTKTPDTQ